jgi:prepilin-type N-terminal cleavage/methylation domain-containing protein
MNAETPSSLSSNSRRGNGRLRARFTRSGDEQGFTLIELLICVTIIPIIAGALAAGLITVFSLQSGVSNRLGDSSDAQIIAASFTKDVQSASHITTDPTISSPTSPLPFCGSGTLLLGLEWGSGTEVAAYVEQLQTGTTYALVRNDCANGPWTTPTSSTTLSYDVLPPCPVADSPATCSALTPPLQPAPVAYSGTTVIPTSTALVPTVGMTSLQFPILEPKSSYSYHLSATPAGGRSTSPTNLGAPTSGASCGFALAGTGQYAATMCFLGFTQTDINNAMSSSGKTCTSTDPGQPGTDVSADVPGGYVMSFCLTVTPGESQTSNPPPVVAVPTPVGGGNCNPATSQPCAWGQLSNGQGFLGNDNQVNGVATPFYAGIGCPVSTPTLENNVVTSSCIDPALFQTNSGGNDGVTLSNIEVYDPEGDLATGYEIITADAETIDPGGSITWTSSLPAARPLPYNLVPNFSSSDLGNACNNVPSQDADNTTGWSIDNGDSTATINGTTYTGLLTGLGTATVKCTSTFQTQSPTKTSAGLLRTGTAMLGITPPTVNGGAAPVTMKAQLVGEGYNAVAFGLLLP